MARVSNGAANDVDEENFEDAYESIPVASKMDLRSAIEECSLALNLFLNNRFSDALELLRPWAKESMYHALGYSTILVLQAAMTFEPQDIQLGISTMKEALHTCQRFRKRNSVVESLSNLMSKQTGDQLSEEEMHAELCYAECLLQKAVLTFVQDENMISFIKGGLKIRTSYRIYKECHQILSATSQDIISSDTYYQYEGGVKMGIGSFNLMISLLPSRILKLLEFIGFSGNRELGLLQLQEGASGNSLRAMLCTITLLMYHTLISLISGTGECDLEAADALLKPYLEKFPNGALILFFAARIDLLKGNIEQAQMTYQRCIEAQQEWKQIHHFCYWDMMCCCFFQQDWLQAYRYVDILSKESKWSKVTYVYHKAAVLSMLPEDVVKSTGEDVVALFRQVESLKLKIGGKSVPAEKFAARKSRRYSAANPVKLIVPTFEMMYVWGGFMMIGKRADLTESILITIEKAETDLQNEKNPNEYYGDDQCLIQFLKGLCLKNLGRLLQAELCFNQVIQSEKRLKYDHYLVPYSYYELGLLCKQQGNKEKAIQLIETAKTNYKKYSMENRLHFKIHAALSEFKGAAPSTHP
ncbi:tetratricopeptide repeat protein 39B-like [Gastrophryne carolinensis]